MSDLEYIHAKFTIPELENQVFDGLIQQKGDDKFIFLKETPYKEDYWKSIDILYAETATGFYTCIECSLYIYDSLRAKAQYLVTEFYEGKLLENSTIPVYKKLVAEVFYLNQWLKPNLIEPKSTNDPYFIAFYGMNNKEFIFQIRENISLTFEGICTFSARSGLIKIKEKSILKIASEGKASRSELFADFYYFLIFFILFLKKIPKTSNLSFATDDEEFKLLGLPQQNYEDDFVVLLEFKDLGNLNELLLKYYEQPSNYAEVIQLMEKSIEISNPEVCFLHLTQALELLHKTFYEFDKNVQVSINDEVNSQFKTSVKSKDWHQIMRYYHFYKIAIDFEIKVKFPNDYIEFIKRIRNSRNYYTHYDKTGYVWKYIELYSINNLIRSWLRALILHTLGVPIEKVRKSVSIEQRSFREEDIFENKFSMRYKNYFAK